MDNLILNQVNFDYFRSKGLIENLSLGLERGKIYGLLGANGAGKSTLMKLMCGLVFPDKGMVSLNGKEISKREVETSRELFLVPEELFFPPVRMDEYVDLLRPFYPNFDLDCYARLKREFSIEKNDKLGSLSYGQKKKFLIAVALSAKTSYIFMDEPTNGLDIPSKSKFRKVVAENLGDDQTIVISTHQVRDLDRLIDPLLIMDYGKIIFNRSIEEIENTLCFRKVEQGEIVVEEVLYREHNFGGDSIVTRCVDNNVSSVDFELLFNAVSANYEIINKVFVSVDNFKNEEN